ncbi:hypothetical protein FHS83_003159 [Rhizomicrobium palustre]|uniref:Outer membrane beta-barrel protein n=1 Tax=Rhizomicrobium palustre TaxID=189966 RepID=A0A846N3L2_9PROT|nr:outer membrane beta-barrel protein [Rhizomicrobium palustre]NIK89841.1 hypothetical protein [Rhizomicrobium palustre]
MALGKLRAIVAGLIAVNTMGAWAAAPSQVPPDVGERARPEYDPVGVPLGAFVFYPKVNMATEYNDNIYAAETGAASDLIFRIAPSLRLTTAWPTDKMTLRAFGGINRYLDHASEDTDTYGVNGDAEFSIHNATALRGSIDFRHAVLARESILSSPATEHPVEYNQGSAHLEATQGFGNFQLMGFADWLRLAYQDSVAPDGSTVFEKDLNYETISGGLRGGYAVSPDSSVFVSGRMFTTEFLAKPPLVPLDRSSHGYEVTGGFNLHVTDVLSGDIGAGYLHARYPHITGSQQDVGTLAVHVALAWYPTLLTTVKFRVGRSIEEAPMQISSGFLVTRYQAEIDHELRRNVVLNAGVEYSDGSFRGTDRRDSQWKVGAGATYLLNPMMSVKLSYAYQSRESEGLARGPGFNSNTISLAFVLQR